MSGAYTMSRPRLPVASHDFTSVQSQLAVRSFVEFRVLSKVGQHAPNGVTDISRVTINSLSHNADEYFHYLRGRVDLGEVSRSRSGATR